MKNRWRNRIYAAAEDVPAGLILLIATIAAVVWSNSPFSQSYFSLGATEVGPSSLDLAMPLSEWAADGVLAIFFFVVGLELKGEFTTGSLRDPKTAAVPMCAAVGGMIVPAIIFTTIIAISGDVGALKGWAIPTATDIAFAITILALFGKGLPAQLRTFLLTLAVVDDLLAIIVIAVFYAQSINFLFLAISVAVVGLFALYVRLKSAKWYVLLALGVVAWYFMHRSGIHATIAGVLLGLVTPARPIKGEHTPRTYRLARYVTPISALFVLPFFAFFASGVTIFGPLMKEIFLEPATWAVFFGLVLGKFIGVLGTTFLITKLTSLKLDEQITLSDLVPIGLLAGIGFTVALLITELAFTNETQIQCAKAAILVGSLVSGLLGAVVLRMRSRKGR